MSLRPPRRDDADDVLQLLVARDTADYGRPDHTLGDLLDDWGSSQLDPTRDTVVSETPDGEIAGYAIVRRQGTFAAVAPDHEGEGIGSALLDWCERRRRELGWSEHRMAIGARNTRAAKLLASRGYRVVRSNWNMALSLEAPGAGGEVNEEVVLRTLDPEADAAAVHALDDVAFAAVPGTEPESLETFSEDHLGAHDLDPGLSRVAELEGRMVGFALSRRWKDAGVVYVDILAVAPEAQGRGIGRTLLLAVFAAGQEAGLNEAQLRVAADNPKGLRLYEGLGMRKVSRLDVYGRAVG